ncbi:MAG TPA: hypothetical protein DDW52_10535, partial [Planctomycetaceae bacterium]|nr:hypothetical protein [Planctomycetaceae bacterium]
MSEETRLADLTGISEASDNNEPMWLVNGALVLVGASIVGVAFSFLDSADNRFLYNPWTYAVATPIALVVLSAVLSTFVSRVVEKSMQLAFLLSVLIHLGLLAYAVNIIIFSKMWPETFQSRTQAQHIAKRQMLQAKQYVHVTNASNSQRRPDYLRHVPTTHQPTEVKQSESPAIQLSRSETADLVSPQPKLKPTNTPHLVERKQPTPTPTELAPQTARLARNDLKSDRLPTPNISTPSESPTNSATPKPLKADSAAINRATADSAPEQLSQPTAQPSRVASSTVAKRAASPASRNSFAQTPSRLSSREPSSQLARNASAIPVPSTSPSQQAASNVAPRSAQLSRQLSSNSLGARSPNTLDSPLTASASAGTPSRASRSSLNDSRQLATGNQAASLPRNSAGGKAAAQSRISIPVLGPQQLANARAPSPLANTREDRRMTPAEQGSAASGSFATSQSPKFDGQQ